MDRSILRFIAYTIIFLLPARLAGQDSGPAKVFAELEQSGRYVDMLQAADLQELPIGISKTIGNIKYTVAFVKAKVYPEYAELSAFARIELPQTDSHNNDPVILIFGAENIKCSYKGGIVGDARLVLLENINIPFNGGKGVLQLKGGLDKATGNFADLSYVQIDCEGFKELGLAADVLFSRDLLVPLNAAREPDPNPQSRVRGSFQTVVRDWNDLLVDISLPPFTLACDQRFGFTVDRAVFDFSDLHNAEGIKFPAVYNTLLDAGQSNLWRGVYVHAMQVLLPEEFSKKGSGRISFGARDLVIDNYGVSGSFFANNLISAGEGDADGWAFSVDSFALRFETNQLKDGYFSGDLKLPVSEKTDLRYTASISENDYLIAVKNNKPLDFSAWKARMVLGPNSSIVMEVRDHKFKPKAILNGYMAVSLNDDPAETSTDTAKKANMIPKLTFQQLTLQTETPYVQVKAMGYEGDIRFNNFPLSLSKINLVTSGKELKLALSIRLNLMKEFSAAGGISIVGKMDNARTLQRWQFDRLLLDEIAIAADMGAFEMKGNLIVMRNDPVYGNGFNASIALKLKKGPEMSLAAQAIFGNTSYRYWMVDDMVSGLTVPVGPVILTGFGGGASNCMRRTTEGAPTFGGSGLTYVPDSTQGLGLKATVLFHIGTEKLVSGNIAFEMLFNSNGGLNKMGFYGQASVLTTGLDEWGGDKLDGLKKQLKKVVDKEAEYEKGTKTALTALGYNDKSKLIDNLAQNPKAGAASISLQLGMEYDFQNSVLHATSEMYVNFLVGIVKGRGANGRAGWSVLHVEPGSWYMHIGTPEDRLGLKLGIGSVNVEAGGYFMMGDKMPDNPKPPKAVSDILGIDAEQLNYTRDLAALSGGRGVAFGTDFSLNTGDLTFLLLYANFGMGAGFDIMARDYGPGAHCAGSSGPIGMNGWYANGQAYAYMQGELGVKVKLLFVNKKIPIIRGAAAVLMQARAPNPVWVKGYMAGNYNLLGGLVSGSFRFKVELGEKCEIVNGGNPIGLAVISDLSPADETNDVAVFAAPQAVFNMKINRDFVLEDNQGTRTYYIKLEQMSVTKDGQPIGGDLEWNSNADAVTFRSFEVLPGHTKLSAKVKVGFYEVLNGNRVLVYSNGQPAVEEKEVTFITGDAPATIPLANIAHCYPLTAQQNYYPQERNKGYIRLVQGQSDLFKPGYIHEVCFVSVKDSLIMPLQYNAAARALQFDLPPLRNSADYTFKVITKPAQQQTSSITEQKKQTKLDEDNTVAVKSKTLSGIAGNAAAASALLTYAFKTSAYNTFAAKVQSIRKVNSNISKLAGSSDIVYLSTTTAAAEPFDLAELAGTARSSGALVQVKAVPEDDYYKNKIYPLVYEDYPIDGRIKITVRDIALGIPPVYAVPVINAYKLYAEQDINAAYRSSTFPYRYDLVDFYNQDYRELQGRVVNQLMGTSLYTRYSKIVTNVFPLITKGDYKIELQYRFPDGQTGTKAYFTYYNPIN